MAQRKGGVNHAGSLAITICALGFERNSGHMRLIGSFFRDTLKKCGYPQKYNEVTAQVSERAVSERDHIEKRPWADQDPDCSFNTNTMK